MTQFYGTLTPEKKEPASAWYFWKMTALCL